MFFQKQTDKKFIALHLVLKLFQLTDVCVCGGGGGAFVCARAYVRVCAHASVCVYNVGLACLACFHLNCL